MQRVANASVRQHLAEMSGRNMRDASVLVLDNASGEIIAYVGGSGALSRAPQLDMVRTKRQAGSTLKPFIYGAAFDARLMTAASLIDDSPTGFAAGSGLYAPQNYDRDFKGWVSARTALAGSLNIPVVKALDVLGQERGYGTLAKLGLEVASESPDFFGYALALGGVDVSLANLTNAYRALSQGGRTSPIVTTVGGLSPTTQVLSADAAFIVSDILADPSARAITFGSDSVLATRGWGAVKTGTSKDLRDNWCIGFSDRYTVGVWVGNADGTPMKDVSGVAGAAPIWADVMHALHRDTASRPPAPPGDLQRTEVTFANGVEPRRREWFLRGTERSHIAIAAPTSRTVRIVYPTTGLIIAQDPDIPKGRERVPVDLSGAVGTAKVKHNGRWLQTAYLAPTPGRHTLELVAATGEVLQRVAFEVR
jgi:penicillin-binding protein 1C